MGLTGVLGRAVFCKSRSYSPAYEQQHENVRGKKWSSSVRSYLCGDDLLFDSVVAEEDSASVNTFVSSCIISSDATVTQPILTNELTIDTGAARADESGLPNEEEEQRVDIHILHKEEAAAIRIQSAFRHYLAKFRSAQAERSSEKSVDADKESPFGESESVGTSLEVQTANSVNVLSLARRPTAQPFKFKEDWDDSTVSSNISKMRMQNRKEAMTRRERALAYAFSQQLRICSNKKASRSDDEETNNIGWSWLERWMAARVPDKNSFHTSEVLKTQKQTSNENVISFENFEEEKESCGSNEVFIRFNGSFSIKSPPAKMEQKSALKPKKNVSKRKTVPSYQFAKEYCKGT